jgi:hypothetical protein
MCITLAIIKFYSKMYGPYNIKRSKFIGRVACSMITIPSTLMQRLNWVKRVKWTATLCDREHCEACHLLLVEY